MRVTAIVIIVCALGLSGSPAAAWTDAPLCVAQQPQLSEYASREYAQPEDSARLLCEADELGGGRPAPLWTAPISPDEARRAMREATALMDSAPADALLKLRLVERAMPRIADRLALQRAGLLMRLNRAGDACDAYRLATDSVEPNVAAEGRIGLTRCLLEAGDKQGELELDRLTRRYPALGERYALQVKLANAREHWRNLSGALALYRNIDLMAPETRAAAEARDALARLRDQGVTVPAYTPQEIVERAERIVQRGTIEAGRSAVGDLLAMSILRGPLKGRVHLLAARVARMEGRWDAVRDEVTLAINSGIPAGEAQRLLPRLTVESLEPGVGEQRIRKFLAGRPVKRLKPGQLRNVLDMAVQFGVRDVASEALSGLTAQFTKIGPQAIYDAAIDAAGVASDDALREAYESLRDVRGMKLAAMYHHARALEGLGRDDEAREEYRDVARLDDGVERYYGVWAESRLTRYEELASGSCERDERGACRLDTASSPRGFISAGMSIGARSRWNRAAAAEIAAVFGEPRNERTDAAPFPNKDELRRQGIIAKLAPLVAIHGEAYPWLARAADLTELERYDDAAAEVGEAYLAYRDACGASRFRAGAEAVLTNALQPYHLAAGNTRRDRIAFDEWARYSLADVADMLEEPGVAIRLRAMRGEPRPRAYSEDVERAAAKFGLDPNLMFAVMRVESVYYRNIVSFAGAVGLMQIMPYTGMRIARALGMSDFNPRELLEPRRNLEFAAWYLSSLIRRFDGRVPLAVAAYNGGPHNVRLWLNAHARTMPLDAFIERIPFRETRGYVKRVMANYAAYRAQEELAMPNLAVTLPRPKPDAIAF